MAYDIALSNPYPGRPAFNLYLYVRRDQTDQANNRSSYAWELRARNPSGSSLTYALDCFGWSVNIGGQGFSGCHNLDFRGGQAYLVLGSGGTGWFGHDAAGNLTLGVSASHGGSIFGVTSVSGSFVTDRIPKVPGATTTPIVDQATTTSLRYRFSGGSDGGSPILEWQAQADEDPAFGSPIIVISTGTTTFTGLTPGTTYYFRSRGRNAVGWGAFGAAGSGTTLPAVPPGMVVTPNLAGTSASVALSPPSGVSSVTNYVVERRPVGGSAVSTTTPTSPLVVSPLTPGASYEWRASAMIGAYQTPWTAWTLVTQPQPNTNPGDFFDGASPSDDDIDYQWEDAADNSRSLAIGEAPLGWRTFAQGAAASGGDGVVIRATGGRSGAFGARVTFFTDATSDGFRGGTAIDEPGVQEVAEGGVYWGSVYVSPSRVQSMAAEIIWLDEDLVEIGSVVGDPVEVPANANPMVRLVVQGVAPEGAVYGATGWTDVLIAGTGGYGHGPYGHGPYGHGPDGTAPSVGWGLWHGGDVVMQDDAMLTIGELYPWFSGDTPDTPLYDYEWLDEPNASISVRTTLEAGVVDPLADPDCPPIPLPPQPPAIADDCIEETGTWRRYWAIIPEDQVTDWLHLVPTIEITTDALAARQVRIRVYRNPDGVDPSAFAASTWEAEQIIRYMPPMTTLTLDGVAQRVWAEVDGANPIAADRLLYGTGGIPATWPVLSCGTPYLISFDVPLDAPEGNLSVDVALTTRML